MAILKAGKHLDYLLYLFDDKTIRDQKNFKKASAFAGLKSRRVKND